MKINKDILRIVSNYYDPFPFRNEGGFIANNINDVFSFIAKYHSNNIILKHNEYEIRWIDEDGCHWTWELVTKDTNVRGERFGRMRIIDDEYDDEVLDQWIRRCYPSPYTAKWEIFEKGSFKRIG